MYSKSRTNATRISQIPLQCVFRAIENSTKATAPKIKRSGQGTLLISRGGCILDGVVAVRCRGKINYILMKMLYTYNDKPVLKGS